MTVEIKENQIIENVEKKSKIKKDIEDGSVAPIRGKKRIPIHKQSSIDYYAEWGLNRDLYHYRWINANTAGNIEKFEQGGYEQCYDKDHSPRRRRRGIYEEGSQYLMRIPKDIYEQDQKDKQKIVDQISEDMGSQQAAAKGLTKQFTYNPIK